MEKPVSKEFVRVESDFAGRSRLMDMDGKLCDAHDIYSFITEICDPLDKIRITVELINDGKKVEL